MSQKLNLWKLFVSSNHSCITEESDYAIAEPHLENYVFFGMMQLEMGYPSPLSRICLFYDLRH